MKRLLIFCALVLFVASLAATPARADGFRFNVEVRNTVVAQLIVCRDPNGRGFTGTLVRNGVAVCGPVPIAVTGPQTASFVCNGALFSFAPIPGTVVLTWVFRGRQGTLSRIRP